MTEYNKNSIHEQFHQIERFLSLGFVPKTWLISISLKSEEIAKELFGDYLVFASDFFKDKFPEALDRLRLFQKGPRSYYYSINSDQLSDIALNLSDAQLQEYWSLLKQHYLNQIEPIPGQLYDKKHGPKI